MSTQRGASLPAERRSARYVKREEREVRREVLIEPLAELGLIAMNGPNDPVPSLRIENGRVVEVDGRAAAEWDTLDHFIVQHGLDLEVAAAAAELDDAQIARMLV